MIDKLFFLPLFFFFFFNQTFSQNYSLKFAGANHQDYIEIPDADVLSPNSFTLELWIKQSDIHYSSSSYYIYAAKDNGITSQEYSFAENESDGLYDYVGSNLLQSSSHPISNEWTHIAVTFDTQQNKMEIFNNGFSQGTVNTPQEIINTDGKLYFGRIPTFPYYSAFEGLIDQIRFSNNVRYNQNFVVHYSKFENDANTIGLWHFDEGTGNIAYDASGNNNHGTIYGATWSSDVPAIIPIINYSLDFDGDYIEIPDADVLSSNSFTIELWIKQPAISGGRHNFYVIKLYGLSSQEYIFAENSLGLYTYVGSDLLQTSSHPVSNEWTHIAATFNTQQNKVEIFNNGISQGALNTSQEIINTVGKLYFGSLLGSNNTIFIGLIDQIRFSNNVRYNQNFNVHYSKFENDTNTIGLWHFDEGTGSVAYDWSGYNNHGRIQGATWSSDSPAGITITSPNGGVRWIIGSAQNITWASSNVENVKLEYTTNNGANWIEVISSTPASAGSYGWTVPNTPSAQCKVRISDVIDSAINDISNEAFTISGPPSITLTSPNGGENWFVDSVQNITWTSSNIENVKLEYTTNNGANWIEVISSTPASAGSFGWTVLNTPSTQCKVRIGDVIDSTYKDMSNNVFSISSSPSIINEYDKEIPKEYFLSQNYPNPLNPSTTIRYAVPRRSLVTIKICDMLGKEVNTFVEEEKSDGYYEVNFDAGNLASGIYFYRMQAGDYVETKKMILLK